MMQLDWVFVPITPTETMLEAANKEWDGRISARAAGVWQAMIAVAPKIAFLDNVRAALEFYADENSYAMTGITMPEGYTKPVVAEPIRIDKGARARAALATMKERK